MECAAEHQFVLAERNLNEDVVALLAESDLSPDKFYLTGFESIVFNQDKLFALSVVLSSVITIDNAVLILNTGEGSLRVADICSRLHLNFILIDDIDKLENTLKYYPHLSYMLICESDTRSFSLPELQNISNLLSLYKTELIVECTQRPLTLTQALMFGVSFMICVNACNVDNRSMVVCRRSRLVQAEGQSRWMMYDLYQYWQRTLSNRNNVIEPMVV